MLLATKSFVFIYAILAQATGVNSAAPRSLQFDWKIAIMLAKILKKSGK
jgi:hypothetical protein